MSVNIEHFLDLFFHRNILIIEGLFGVVLLGVIFLTIRSFLRAEGAENEMNLSGLEEGLKKILENHAGNSAAKANDSASVEGDAIMEEMATQIERLKLQVMQKTEEVEQLKAGGAVAAASAVAPTEAPAKAPSSFSGGAPTELEEKVRELEARLSEYSIIEDDIADLSFYKEETVRLQAEIDKLKAKLAEYEAGGPAPKFMAPPAAAPAPAAPAASAPPQPIAAAPAPVAAVMEVTSTAASVAPETPDIFGSLDDDIMAEFERAVAEQKASSSAQKVATALTTPAAPQSAAAPTPSVVSVAEEPPEATQPVVEASAPAPVAPAAALEVVTESLASTTPAPQPAVAAAPIVDTPAATTATFETSSVIPLKTEGPTDIKVEEKDDDEALKATETSEPTESIEATELKEEVIGGINLDKMLSEVGGLPEDGSADTASNALEQELDTEKLLQEATGMEKSDSEADEDFSELIKKEGA